MWSALVIATGILCTLVRASEADPALLWGPYRPNVYFGMRPQIPHSLITGLMWYSSDSFEGFQKIRHDANNEDEISRYGWTHYDPRKGGRQVIHDEFHHLNLTTDLIKSPDGSGWEVLIRGKQPTDQVQTIVFYASLEGEGHLKLASMLAPDGIEGDVKLVGKSPELGKIDLTVTAGSGKYPTAKKDAEFVGKPGNKAHYVSLKVPNDNAWRAKDIFLTLIQDELQKLVEFMGDKIETLATNLPIWAGLSLSDSDKLGGNTHLIQKSFQGPFEFRIQYNYASPDFEKDFSNLLEEQQDHFDQTMTLHEPFNSPEYKDFAREMISNLAGGIGYFYGDYLVGAGDDNSEGDEPVTPAAPIELFTMTPSRSFFPRGFYWDEGFHLLSIYKFDINLALDIISSWFESMDEDGWIPREQILGPEGRSRVPDEFQVQHPDHANPPTPVMFLAYLGTQEFDHPRVKEQLRTIYPLLKTHFNWFRRSQRGEVAEFDRELPAPREAYRWRGRTPTHVLTSGMDDYPRASDPSEGELHVDLLSWVGSMATSLGQLARVLGYTEDFQRYNDIRDNVVANLNAVHWSEDDKSYCDITVDEFEEDVKVCHVGYVTILPMLLRLVDPEDSEKLSSILDQIRDPEQLWAKGGIRSLSKRDSYFGTGENYWRGPVWVQVNFLVLHSLQFYAESTKDAGLHQRLASVYSELREKVAKNVYDEWKRTGYVWEQYDGISGAAKGSRQFTGWTALAANIMALPESISRVEHDDL